jgi:ABC-type oligopeptide transport system substrate-binding subunit
MKTTRILLAFAAALSLGLAVFASVNNHSSTAQSSSKSIFNGADNSDPGD